MSIPWVRSQQRLVYFWARKSEVKTNPSPQKYLNLLRNYELNNTKYSDFEAIKLENGDICCVFVSN